MKRDFLTIFHSRVNMNFDVLRLLSNLFATTLLAAIFFINHFTYTAHISRSSQHTADMLKFSIVFKQAKISFNAVNN